MTESADRLEVGRVHKAHGLKGDVNVSLTTDRLERVEPGSRLFVDGEERVAPDDSGEYQRLYAAFAELIAAGRSHVDLEPLRVVADAFMISAREEVEAFHD